MNKITCFIIILILFSCKENSYIKLDEGVSIELAEYRKKQISNVQYNLSFDIPHNLEDSIAAKLRLKVSILDLKQPLVLDFKPENDSQIFVKVNRRKIKVQQRNEHIVIPSKSLKLGANVLEIEFTAGEMSLNRKKDFLYTLLVPDRARTLFPCFDQPNIKSTFKLNISTPKSWKVVCGSELDNEFEKDTFTKRHFKETEKMSTYLFSFVAGKFDLDFYNNTGFKMNHYYRETDKEKIDMSISAIFNLHHEFSQQLENYTNYKYPFQKLDFASIYSHPYGGMEHVGAIQYNQSNLFLDSSATKNQKLRRAKLIAHEISHSWFGNLVTMNWFDDVWLKEVFANLMADKIVNPYFPNIDHNLHFMTSHYPHAYNVDRTRGANPIRQNLENLNNAGSLYGNIIYHKAPIMMRQLELLLGSELFRQGIEEYLKKYEYENAEWKDLIEIFDNKTDLDLIQWSNVWVNKSGRPKFNSKIEYDKEEKIQSFELYQEAENGSDNIWPQVFDIMFLYSDKTTHSITIQSNMKSSIVFDAVGLRKPDLIIFNSNGLGYGVFPTDDKQLENISEIDNSVSRGYCYINVYENLLNGTVSVDNVFNTFLKGLANEEDELILKMIANYLNDIYWIFLSPEQRTEYQNQIENLLFSRIQKDITPSIKKTLFKLYRNIAHINIGLDRLYKIWSKDISIQGLILNDEDFTDIAMLLAVYNHNNIDEILIKTRNAIKDSNKLERFDFLLPALSNNNEIRAQFFMSFADAKNREIENWVLSACYYIHHPIRQESAINYLDLSLNLLEDIKVTGDIFFPKSWLNNTIGLYSSEQALNILEDFIDDNPDLDPKLFSKLMQSTDNLYRTQKLLYNY